MRKSLLSLLLASLVLGGLALSPTRSDAAWWNRYNAGYSYPYAAGYYPGYSYYPGPYSSYYYYPPTTYSYPYTSYYYTSPYAGYSYWPGYYRSYYSWPGGYIYP